jgi:acetoin utilization deacetylase AcuC-like enzyme
LPLLTPISPRAATLDELSLIHQIRYINYIKNLASIGGGAVDSDTKVSAASYKVALYAAGGAIRAAEAVMEGQVDSAFALVRPPGHHATADRAMGFCLFNNIAIAAKWIISKYGLARLAIVDFDVHHGNGTQEAFYVDPKVLYISTHQSPSYPGTGWLEECGSGEALGTKINIPLPPGCGDTEYLMAYEKIVAPAVRRFKPQIILVSAGYDAHWLEKIAAMQVSIKGFIQIVRAIKLAAAETCNSRMALVLEGGYQLESLAACVKATFEVLLGNNYVEDPLGSPQHARKPPNIQDLILRIRETHDLI